MSGNIVWQHLDTPDAYMHWEELRHRIPPEGLNHHGWWYLLKLGRLARRTTIPLDDAAGRPFIFNFADPLPELCHDVDSFARGVVAMPEPITNPDTRGQYIVRSLIEEAFTSSQLEGAATTRKIAKEMIRSNRPPRDKGERMVLNNYRTMQRIKDLRDEPFSKDLVFEIHRLVTVDTLNDPSGINRFRRPDEDIKVAAEFDDEILHVPPPADQLEDRMEAMCRFANGETPVGFVHPLIRSMALHFWLAYDHPFIDGNGRTARAMFYWCMLRNGYWLLEFVSISSIILKAPIQYTMAYLHTETDDNDLTYFLLYHAKVVRRALDELHEYIKGRSGQIREIEGQLQGLSELNHRQKDLIRHGLHHPGRRYDIRYHQNSHGVTYQTARVDLLDLVDRKLFRKHQVGRAFQFSPAPDMEARLKGD